MNVKTINSTQAQNNFGRLLDDVTEQGTRYLVQRFGKVKAAIVPLDDFRCLLGQDDAVAHLLRETNTIYSLGQQQTEDKIQILIEQEPE